MPIGAGAAPLNGACWATLAQMGAPHAHAGALQGVPAASYMDRNVALAPARGPRRLDDILEKKPVVRVFSTSAPAHRFKSGANLAAIGLAAMLAVWAMSLFSWILALAFLAGLLAVAAWRFAHRPRPMPEAEAAPAVPIEARSRPGRGMAEPRRSSGEPHSGDVLGQYQLLACVGEGGMGRVWAARHVGSVLQRLVAVKTAIRDDEERTEVRHLFMDEARIALLVRHPNVCGVHEFGEHEGVLYQVMEWCDGASLRQVLDRLPDN